MRRREPAQVYTWTAVLLGLLLAFGGLVADASRAFIGRATLQRLADAAARAGALEVDEAALRAAPDACPRLNVARAEEAAARYLAAQSHVDGRVEATTDAVAVEARRQQPTTLLALFGAGPVELRARAVARPRAGIEAARTECA